MAHSTGAMPVVRTSDPVLTTLRVLAVLTVVNLLVQFLTAGELVTRGGDEGALPIHSTGAIVLHVLSGLAAIAALAYWRLRGAPLWPGIVAAVVFVLTFVQAYFGSGRTLYIHVPGAMILTIGAVAVAVWAFLPTARGR
jgi:predicted small integral membrane protein